MIRRKKRKELKKVLKMTGPLVQQTAPFKNGINSSGVIQCYSLFYQTSQSIDIAQPVSFDSPPGLSNIDCMI